MDFVVIQDLVSTTISKVYYLISEPVHMHITFLISKAVCTGDRL